MPILLAPDTVQTRPGVPARGGKPPADQPPTHGHGGGGDGRLWGPGPRAGLYRVRALLFSVLAVEAALFAALLLLFHARLSGTHIDPRMLRQVRDWPSALIPPILFLNSAILVTSMLTMARARRHIFAEFDLIDEWLGMGRPAL